MYGGRSQGRAYGKAYASYNWWHHSGEGGAGDLRHRHLGEVHKMLRWVRGGLPLLFFLVRMLWA